ncbi:unnamed protein product [Ascophyllum nodosum]
MVSPISELPLRVRRVKIVGNNRTKTYLVEDQLQQDAYKATTVDGVYTGLVFGAHKLESLGLFDSVSVSMDATDDGSLDQTDVTITVKEKNWYKLKSGATTAGKQSSFDASEFSNLRYTVAGALKNALGHGETVDVGYNSPLSGLESRTFNARLALPSLWRSAASFTLDGLVDTVREGVSVKYTFTDDSRNDTFVPSLGSFFRASVEGAGEERMVWDPGGWGGRMTWETSGVSPLGSCKRTHFSDRFNLGGPMSLRGFPFHGVGPRAPKEEGGCPGGDALGGDIRYTASASLGFPFLLPSLANTGWRGFLFTNLGNLTTWDTPLTQYARDTRVSVGFAAAWNFMGVGRLEINYARVLRQSARDLRREGWLQFGFGVSFE